MCWFVVVWLVGTNLLVGRDVPKWFVLFSPSLEPYVAVGSVVWLDVFCEGGVYAVNPSSQLCFSFVEVIVASFVPVDVEGKAPVILFFCVIW